MQSIRVTLPPVLAKQLGDVPVAKADAIRVPTFRLLMEYIARIAYVNKDHLLFFRGQETDYKNKAGGSTFYPSIYRGERLTQPELRRRFDLLDGASVRLVEAFRREGIEGASDVQRRRFIQWSILQHYEVCATPLLDFTQSVRVAASFASLGAKADPYVFVFGLPYVTNRISINSEQDIVNVRLLSICPPEALRPYYQEGYLAGTDDVTSDFASKDELDFNSRLLAKFQIGRGAAFWGKGFNPIPKEALYPLTDRVLAICKGIKVEVDDSIHPGDLGRFLQAWTKLESRLLSLAREFSDRVFSVREAISVLVRNEQISDQLRRRLDALRETRNRAVHASSKLYPGELSEAESEIGLVLKQLSPRQTSA